MCFDLDLRSGGFCQHSRYHPLLFATKSQDVVDFLLYPCQACSLLNPTRESNVMALKHLSVQRINRNINENKFEDFFLLGILLFFIRKHTCTYFNSHEQVLTDGLFINFIYMVLSDLMNIYRTHFLLNLQYI